VLAKAEAALASGLTPIICVGETEVERESGAALAVIARQLRGSLPAEAPGSVVVAYEPVWAIGTGKTAQPSDVVEVHSEIRRLLQERLGAAAGAEVRILYGGSVKPGNAAELLASTDVDGALVGGASLKAEDFWAIAQSCP
jgi:triosephosphate isomerase